MVNVIAVFIAGIAAMVLGFLWYGPLFGKQWMKLTGVKAKDMKKSMTKAYLIGFVSNLVMAYVLATFVANIALDAAMVTGFWLWLGFIATITLGSVLWGGKSVKLWVLNNAFHIVNIAIMIAILTTI